MSSKEKKYENKPGFGGLFRNKKATGKQPDFQGSVTTPDGKEYELAGWTKEGKAGKYVSLKIQEPREKDGSKDVRHEAAAANDDLPF